MLRVAIEIGSVNPVAEMRLAERDAQAAPKEMSCDRHNRLMLWLRSSDA